MKNEYLFPGIAIIAKPVPTFEHPLEDAHEAKKQKLSDPAWAEG